ncbi:MAG: DNA-directed RNA polymerase subunit F [Candidatus Aenigmarchaeota archaeon]|nr:DNA-directed RNA polymerase subunit F [Candidatus Aenigmarchaeota archaeon]
MKVIQSRAISAAEARDIVETAQKDRELGYEQNLAAEHLKKFVKLKTEDAKKLGEELASVIRMSPETQAQIINILPKTPDELRLIFAREKFSLKEDETGKILEIVKKYS